MAQTTLTYTVRKQAFVRPNRNYDYLYDPNYYVSSSRDHAKESFKVHTGSDRIRYVPNFKTMFSSLRHYPRQTVTLDVTDPVPSHVDQQWKGYGDQARETIIRYKKFNYNPDVEVPPKHFEPAHVDGKNRYRYAQRPIIPFLPQIPPNLVLAKTRVDPLIPPGTSSFETDGFFILPKTRSVHVQTDYRETETQTDPYSPEYVIRPGSQPELLTLCSLSYGNGLPAGLAEVEMIERARAKRAWEATLPPLNDLDQMDERRRMMEEQERKEWEYREQEIKKMQEERMELVKKMLRQREVDHQALNSKRLELLWSKKQLEKNKKFRRLHSDHVKALRKLTKRSSNVEGRLEKRNIVKQYTKFDSHVYAPMTRIGVYMDNSSEQYNVKSKYSTTLEGLMDLEDSLPLHTLYPSMKPPVPSGLKPVGSKARAELKMNEILKKVHSDITKDKIKGKEKIKPLRLLRKVIKPVPRPPTPTIAVPKEGEEEKELALILLQRIIRGRAIQTKMFEGKDRRQQLIKELRTTHALQNKEQIIQKKEKEDTYSKQSAQKMKIHKDSMIEDALEAPVASLISQHLDFLNKELVRLQEERRISAFVMLAERQRRLKEAEESGRRQREERLRRTEDEIFKQMMRVHQGSVDTYLEDVILQSMEATADQEARKDIGKRSQAINETAHKVQHTELSSKEFVAEMVYSFLLPEVEKQTIRERVHQDQRKHLLAAHRVIYKTINEELLEEDGGLKSSDHELFIPPIPETPTSEPPNPETPTSEPPNPETPTSELPNPETPTSELPDPETPTSELPDPETPTSEPPNPETPTSELPDPKI